MALDGESRDKIRNNMDENFFVEAGAGSGKTSVLVDRMLAMVENGIPIEKICAITFTKAAAGEFYQRFQKRLSESSSPKAKEALNKIDLCFMGTIDSFCNMVISEHPMAAGIPSNASVIDDAEMDRLYDREFVKIRKGEYGQDMKMLADRFARSYYNAREIFTLGMHMLSGHRNTHLNYKKSGPEGFDEYLGKRRERVIEVLLYLYEHPEALATDRPQKAADAYATLMDSFVTLTASWDQNISSTVYKLNQLKELRIRKEYEKKMDELGPGWERFFLPKTTKKGTLQWFEVNQEEDPFLVSEIKNRRFAITMELIAKSVPLISETLKKEGNLTFSDYLIYLRDMLRRDAQADGKLIRHIHERHSYFLVDEFQDTNPIQAEIFFYLTAREVRENWKECIPEPGSLFIVGDPKQSIYRFRNADVASFLRIRKLFENPEVGQVLQLTKNFRSTDHLCQWFNRTFRNLFPEDREDQSMFHEIPVGEKPEYEGTFTGVYQFPSFNHQDHTSVSDIIWRIVHDPDLTIQDVNTGSVRLVNYSDIMVITPAKGNLQNFMHKFEERGIPYRLEGKVLFHECKALISIAYLMQAIADPYDAKALFFSEYLSGIDVDADQIRRYAGRAKAMSPAAVFSMVLNEERIFARLGTEHAEYVYFALELLRDATVSGKVCSLKEAAAFVHELITSESGQERCVQLRRDENRVHIANLHKVKGLQAPIVILADAYKGRPKPSLRVDYSADPPETYVFALDRGNTTTDFDEEKEKEAMSLENERNRLLYVAATRAANALIIEDLYDSKKKRMENSMWLGLFQEEIEDIFSRLKPKEEEPAEEVQSLDANELYDQAEEESVLKQVTAPEHTYRIRRPSTVSIKGVTSSDDHHEDTGRAETQNNHEGKRSRGQALLLGTMVHKIMEALVRSKNTYDADDLVKDVLQEYRAEGEEFRSLLSAIISTIRSGGYPQSNQVPQDILRELLSAEEVHCELPFCYKTEEDIWHGVMDAAYLKSGKWHIIDYKTNIDADDLDEHYKAQLQAYVQAFREMTGEEADAYTYHIEV